VKGNVSAQRAVINAIQQLGAEPQARRNTGAAGKKDNLNEMTDQELMEILAATQRRKT
jgi:hypothetical protein